MNALPPGFTVHPPTMDDVAVVFDIITATDTALYGAPEQGYTLDDLRHDWQARQQRLVKEGFTQIRRSWRMEIDLHETPPKPQWPEGIVVRTFISGQEERTLFDAIEEAFQDHWGYMPGNFEQWQHWTVERKDFDPSLWFLACNGNEIAGTSLCEYQTEDRGWVNDLAVRRPWRRKGLGMALLYHSFGEFYRRGIYNVGLEVDSQNLTGATRLYERVGMHATRQYDTYEKELRSGVEPSIQSLPMQ